jgi:hypothetical protein
MEWECLEEIVKQDDNRTRTGIESLCAMPVFCALASKICKIFLLMSTYLFFCLAACNNPRAAERIIMKMNNVKFYKQLSTYSDVGQDRPAVIHTST